MNYKDLWTSHSHRINADDSEKYMDEEDFKIAILEWESAKTVSRVELPVILPKPNPTVCKLQSLLVEADAIRTEIQGMETFNDERIRQGNSVGYSQEHFSEMAEQLRNVAKQMKELANTCEA